MAGRGDAIAMHFRRIYSVENNYKEIYSIVSYY